MEAKEDQVEGDKHCYLKGSIEGPSDSPGPFGEMLKRREKRLPKPTLLDKALKMIHTGAAEVNLIRLANEASMDDKLASLITYVQGHPHVVSVELQASKIFRLVILSC